MDAAAAAAEDAAAQLSAARLQLEHQALKLSELEPLKHELEVALEQANDARDRLSHVQRELAEVKAEAAARTPIGATVAQVRTVAGSLYPSFPAHTPTPAPHKADAHQFSALQQTYTDRHAFTLCAPAGCCWCAA
jgi:hypothetical protein